MDARDTILKAATHLFATRGFNGTSLQLIADAVGMRKPSLLYHFPSKDALRLGVLDQLLEHWSRVLPRLLMVAAGTGPRFESVVDEVVNFFDADPNRARLLLREILDRPDDMRARLSTHVRPWVGVVAQFIRQSQEAGRAHPDVDPEAYVLQVIHLIVSGIATASALGEAVLPATSDLGDPRERHRSELKRIAACALFIAKRPTPHAGDGSNLPAENSTSVGDQAESTKAEAS